SGETLVTIDTVIGTLSTIDAIQVSGQATVTRGIQFGVADTSGKIQLIGLDTSSSDGSRMIHISLPTSSTVVGAIQINGEDTNLTGGMSFTSDGRLVAVDGSQTGGRRVIEIDIDDTTLSSEITAAGSISARLSGFGLDGTDRAFAVLNDAPLNSVLYISPTTSFIPVASANGDLAVNLNFVALTTTSANQVFAIRNTGSSQELYRFDSGTTNASSAVRLGRLTNQGHVAISDIRALDASADGRLYFAGKVAGSTSEILFYIALSSITPGGGDQLATAVGALSPVLTASINALAFRGAALFGVYRNASGQDRLIEIDRNNAVVADRGAIRVGSETNSARIIAMDAADTDNDGVADSLVGVDASGSQRRLVKISSTVQNTVGAISAIAFNNIGDLYVITQDFDGNAAVDADALPINNLTPPGTSGLDVALIKVNEDFVTFNRDNVHSLTLNGLGVITPYTAMTFDPSTGQFLAASTGAAGSVLQGVNPNSGVLTNLGAIILGNNTATTITGLAFAVDASDQTILVGLDNRPIIRTGTASRLVSISPASGAATALSEAGAVGTFNGLASYADPGLTRPLLFATDGNRVIAGSAVTMPLDEISGATTVTGIHGADFQVGAATPRLSGVDVSASFKTQSFANSGGFTPPDTGMAVGPTSVVQTINSSIAIYDKATGASLQNPQPLQTFFGALASSGQGPTSAPFDPVVAYDANSGRFIVATLEVDIAGHGSWLDIAVSRTSDPLQGFTDFHRIDTKTVSGGDDLWADFPRLGWTDDAFLLTFNMYDFPTTVTAGVDVEGSFDHVKLVSIAKSSMLDNNSTTLTAFQSELSANQARATLAPARMYNAPTGTPGYFVEEGGNNTLHVTRMTNLLTPTPSVFVSTLNVSSYSTPPAAHQPGTTIIDPSDGRILSVAWRNGRLVAAHTVGADNIAHARWYDINTTPSTPTLTQQGDISQGPNVSTYYPSIDINSRGDLAMTFMESSAAQPMSMYVTGRGLTDTLGTMRQPTLVVAGQSVYSSAEAQPFRAGDYSGIGVDPVDDTTFWAANEYATASGQTNWATQVAKFSVSTTPTVVGSASSNLLYFVASNNTGTATGTVNATTGAANAGADALKTDRLYTIDVTAGVLGTGA
ncbi:MAG: hypothetical protein NTW19_00090, partial [Planctomycetota bacterium]|nr:hypothetical protein [Planctomycetota bacterium]